LWPAARFSTDASDMEKAMYKRNALYILLGALSLSLLLLAAGSVEAQQQERSKMESGKTKESPFACNVSGLTAEQRQRWLGLIKKLGSSNQEVRELADGYAFRFAADSSTIQDLAEFIVYERLCCPFFDLELAAEREGGPVWLRLRGREGVKEFIRNEFGIK
jgi:hypothetical protein